MTGKFQNHSRSQQRKKTPAKPSRSLAPVDGHNWLNETARELNNQIYQHRQRQPSTATSVKWHEEYLSSGAQYRMTWQAYRAQKLKQWRDRRDLAGWRFGTGRYQGELIGKIIRHNIGYIIWVLENQPRGKTARQIMEYISRDPSILDR